MSRTARETAATRRGRRAAQVRVAQAGGRRVARGLRRLASAGRVMNRRDRCRCQLEVARNPRAASFSKPSKRPGRPTRSIPATSQPPLTSTARWRPKFTSTLIMVTESCPMNILYATARPHPQYSAGEIAELVVVSTVKLKYLGTLRRIRLSARRAWVDPVGELPTPTTPGPGRGKHRRARPGPRPAASSRWRTSRTRPPMSVSGIARPTSPATSTVHWGSTPAATASVNVSAASATANPRTPADVGARPRRRDGYYECCAL